MKSQSDKQLMQYGPFALVTGASEGIGRAFAWALAQKGFNLILVARRENLLVDLADEIERMHGVECHVFRADLGGNEGVDQVLEFTKAIEVGMLVCNAGFGASGDFLDSDLSMETEMIHVNCIALAKLTHEFGKRFKARGHGAVVLLASIVATQGVARSANYAATKAYVLSLGEGLQEEWRGSGVDLLIVAPGPVHTGFSKRSNMQFGVASSPEIVARESINGLGRKKIIHPGKLAKLMSFGVSVSPRFLRVKVFSWVMRGMTQY